MHALHRPHLPRLISVTIVAAILAIAISLALASTLRNISQSRGNPGTPARYTAPAPIGFLHTTAPRGMSNPFADPLNRPPSPLPWPSAGRWSPPAA